MTGPGSTVKVPRGVAATAITTPVPSATCNGGGQRAAGGHDALRAGIPAVVCLGFEGWRKVCPWRVLMYAPGAGEGCVSKIDTRALTCCRWDPRRTPRCLQYKPIRQLPSRATRGGGGRVGVFRTSAR